MVKPTSDEKILEEKSGICVPHILGTSKRNILVKDSFQYFG